VVGKISKNQEELEMERSDTGGPFELFREIR